MKSTVKDMDSALMQLILMVNNASRQDPEYHIASNLLKNLLHIPKMSIEEMAEKCFTSSATLSRFCKRLGYRNYVVLRGAFEPAIEKLEQERSIYCGYDKPAKTLSIDRVVSQCTDALESVRQQLSFLEVERAVDAIYQAKNIYLLANEKMVPAIIEFQYNMLLDNRYVQYLSDWVNASEIEHNSVRILPGIFNSPDLTTKESVTLNTVERLRKPRGNLLDIHICITETVPFVTSERSRFTNDGQTARLILQCVLSIIHTTYSEKYIRLFDESTD